MIGNIYRAVATGHSLTATPSLSGKLSEGPGDVTTRTPQMKAHLALLQCKLLVTSGSPATVSVWLCSDAAGDQPFTEAQTVNIATGITTAAKRGFGLAIDVPFQIEGGIYVACSLNTGEATAEWNLHFRQGG